MSRMDITSSRLEDSEKMKSLRKTKSKVEGKSEFPSSFASRASEAY